MTVGQRCECAILAGICQRVSFRQVAFGPGVFNFLAVRVLLQVLNLRCPFIGSLQRYAVLGFITVRQQLHCQARRADAILVMSVAPDLLHRSFSLFIVAAVRDGVDPLGLGHLCDDRCFVTGHRRFGHGVLDLLAALVLLQLGPAVLPFIFSIQFNCIARSFAVCHQLYRHACGTEAFLIAAVFPDLADLDFGFFGRMAVCQRCDCANLVSVRQRVAKRQRFFTPGIHNFIAVCVLLQVLKLGRPAVALVQDNVIAGIHTILQQFHAQACRTLAVLVVRVVPDLDYGGLSLLVITAVRHAVRPFGLGHLCDDRRLVVGNRCLPVIPLSSASPASWISGSSVLIVISAIPLPSGPSQVLPGPHPRM